MNKSIKSKISILFFGQFFIAGSIVPILALYLKDYLHFSGGQIGIIMAVSAVTAFAAPLLSSIVADRFISAERLYGLCHLTAGIVMFLLAFQRSFLPFLFLYLLFFILFGPTNSLLNAVAFHHSPGGRRKFSGMRLWGTVGWILVAFLFSFLWLRRGGDLRGALFLCSGAGIIVSGYTFFLIPRGELRAEGRKRLFPVEISKVFMRRDVLLLCLLTFLFSFSEKVYYFGLSIFLRSLEVPEAAVMPVSSIAQIVEVLAMVVFVLIVSRLGNRKTMILGASMVLVKYLIFMGSRSLFPALIGLCLHGPAFTFFMITGFIYLDEHCEPAIRTGVHQIFMILEAGFASLLANLTAGFVLDRVTGINGIINFRIYWMVPAFLALTALLILILFFPKKSTAPLNL